MISQIRAYVDARIKAVDPNLNAQETQVFGDDNAGKHLASKKYNLIIQEVTSSRDDDIYTEEISCRVDIYVKPKAKAIKSFDDLIDKARCIRDEIINRRNIPKDLVNNYIFFDIEAETITPIQEISNDKAFRMQLEFIVTGKYKLT